MVARQLVVEWGDPLVLVAMINVVGCLLLGLLVGAARGRRWRRWVVPLLGTGFCGSFTTFSSVTVLITDPSLLRFLVTALQLLLGVLAAWVGLEFGVRTGRAGGPGREAGEVS